MKILFVCGIPRSGTTALASYLNVHPGILISIERYRGVPRRHITPQLFERERLLDMRPEETRHAERNTGLIASKDFTRLRWIGDKLPAYAHRTKVLQQNIPDTRFIAIYRPLPEVAASFEARKAAPKDTWPHGYKEACERWNRTLRDLRRFARHNPDTLLMLENRAFFSEPELHIQALERFLGVPFERQILLQWERLRDQHIKTLANRTTRSPLTDDQMRYLEAHKDAQAERWILGKAWRDRHVK